MKWITSLGIALIGLISVHAQETFPVNGVVNKQLVRTALEHATVHINATQVIENATVVFYQGRIEQVGPSNEVQINGPVVRHDLKGLHVYPAFVDVQSQYALPEVQSAGWNRRPQDLSDKKGAFGWNEAIRPETEAATLFNPEDASKSRDAYLKGGFGSVITHVQDGIVRGTGALVGFAEDPRIALIDPEVSAHFSFRKGSSSQDYPRSLMGATALLKQTFYDADWYGQDALRQERRETNLSLEAFNAQRSLPAFFEAGGWEDALRADYLGDEVGHEFILLTGNNAYQRIDELVETKASLVLSLDCPEAFDVSDPYVSRLIGLDELKHWELAPTNAARVHAAGMRFALTADGLKSPSEIRGAVWKAIEYGLPESVALAALTEVPASMLGVTNDVGSIAPGLLANVLITDGPIFHPKAQLLENWNQGEQHVYVDRMRVDVRGTYDLALEDRVLKLEVSGDMEKPKAKILLDSTEFKVDFNPDGRMLSMGIKLDTLDINGWWRISGNIWMDSRIWEGRGQRADGSWFEWSAIRQNELDGEAHTWEPSLQEVQGEMIWPFVAYGNTEEPSNRTVWFEGATVWTCDEAGTLETADVVIQNGKILAVGQRLDEAVVFGSNIPAYERIDATGKHLTPGIIDEHTHIAATRGINEGTQASSAEVSIQSAVNSEDVNIYRQLAGGVTCAQILHGSANPIGGQSAIIKFRWGASPREMLFEEASPFIKFALGENVKQSNWGNDYQSRFPQTRMGVEQVYYDHFYRAREYDNAWKAYRIAQNKPGFRLRRNESSLVQPRRDLELETLAQILNEERFVTCHSYRQDEINMLMHVADSMGFTINTFTHILEGYKVADKMASHGAGGSSFSDWWAYKYEVKDAIPYNGAVLHGQGIVTAFNSDDAEMARRLNQEAAKAVKYGGVSEEEALKFVTINPAKLLRIDHRVGSIVVGKDADLVLWDDHPLSVYARAEQTYVDGIKYFDLEEDQAKRLWMQSERARLIQAMKLESEGGGRTPTERVKFHYHCDTLTDENR
ncbi:MAG: amidohydrolase family protein [Flavobacteriales bacterium]